jgi:hypothetical protein
MGERYAEKQARLAREAAEAAKPKPAVEPREDIPKPKKKAMKKSA